MTNPTCAQEDLANARANVAMAAERAEAAHATHNLLLVRKTEAESRNAEAIRDVRENKISEEIGAMRMAQATEDLKELNVLIEQGAVTLQKLNLDFDLAQRQQREAEDDARREEQELTATELSVHISKLKAVLSDAVEERHQLYLKMNLGAAAAELERQLRQLEQDVLAVAAERYRIQKMMDPKSGNWAVFYKPNQQLYDLVLHGRVKSAEPGASVAS
jgi:hypothetical protein